jgi:ABC-2 type transport system permease protein
MIGSLDFSFVLIYLFPLIIIALCYNLLSEEKEEGTWQLVLSQSNQPLKLLQAKIWIRFLSVLFVLFLLFGAAKLYLNLSFNLPFFAFILCSVLYIGFWFSLTWLVVSFQKKSSQNALILLSLWVFLVILTPVSINVISKKTYSVPEAFEILVKGREGYHNKWDEPKEPTVAKFQSIYPQLKQFSHPKEKDFSWFWYYAMQHMGDAEAKSEATAFKEKLKQRDKFISLFGFIFPPIHTQLSLNAITQSDMNNYLQFLNKLEHFHEQKRLYFYPKIFNESKVEKENWKQFGLEYFSQKPNIKWFTSIFPLLFFVLLILFIANRKFNTSIH